MSGQWLPQGIANNLNKGVRVRTIKQSRIFDFVTEYVDFSLTILVWEIVWEVFSVIILVYFSEKLTNLVCSYCWECWDLLISHQQPNVLLNSCHYCQELLLSVCGMRNQQFQLLTNHLDYLNNNTDEQNICTLSYQSLVAENQILSGGAYLGNCLKIKHKLFWL